ncbi:MAG: SAM-dependent methyltransferase, partial [Chlorobi bacterium]|nr:SAM-dependent methyltransferase [Chlorobiota bacterium]
KYISSLKDIRLQAGTFDVVFFDAFSPAVQPEMWTEEIFSKIALSMKPGGVLTTYSTKGTVKRALKANGFTIEKLPGPPGKREILRAVLKS